MIAVTWWSFAAIAALALRVTVVLALAWVGAQIAFRRSAATRHAVWATAFVAALALPMAGRLMPVWAVPVLPPEAIGDTAVPLATTERTGGQADGAATLDVTGLRITAPVHHQAAADPSSRTAASSAPAAPSPLAAPVHLSPLEWTLLAWAVVAFALIARYVVSLASVYALVRRADDVVNADWRDAMDVAAAELGLAETPRLVTSAEVAVPFTCGFLRPTLALPESALAWSDERIGVVLRHELAHVTRRDCMVQAVTHAACAAYWFHPLAWIGARHLRAERERACDDLVLALGTRGSTYAEHLLDIARAASLAQPRLATAALAMAKPSELEGRLLAILDPRRDRNRASRGIILQVAAAAVLLVLPLASVRMVARASLPLSIDQTSSAPSPASSTAQGPEPVAPMAATLVAPHATTAPLDSTAGNTVSPAPMALVGVGGGIHGGVAGGISGGVAGGIRGGMARGVAEGVSRGVGGGVSGGIAGGWGGAKGPRWNVGAESEAGHQASPAVVAALTEALKDSDAEVRKSAMQALVRLRSTAVFEPLVAALKDSDAEVRQQAAFGLGQLRDPRASTALTGGLKDEDADVRQQCAFALGQLRDVSAVPGLTAALKDPNEDVRQQAVFALGQIRDPKAAPGLMAALSDAKPDVRQQAAFALGQLRSAEAVPGLIQALKDSDADVRQQAAFALSQVGDDSAVEALTVAMKDPNAEVRQQAIFALGQIAGGEGRHREPTPRAVIAPMATPTPTPAPTPQPRLQ